MVSLTPAADPEVEVSSKAKRRVFTAKYKAKILREADACAGKHGAMGALLRREGLYASHLASWRGRTYYRKRAPMQGPQPRRPSPPRRLPDAERQAVLDVLHEPRFVDQAPPEVHAARLEEGR